VERPVRQLLAHRRPGYRPSSIDISQLPGLWARSPDTGQLQSGAATISAAAPKIGRYCPTARNHTMPNRSLTGPLNPTATSGWPWLFRGQPNELGVAVYPPLAYTVPVRFIETRCSRASSMDCLPTMSTVPCSSLLPCGQSKGC
jgi:hypothetical protein